MRKLLVFFAALLLCSCVNVNKTIKLFDGEHLTSEEVVTLLPPFKAKLAMELYINGEKVGESCQSICPFVQPIQILPGSHRFASNNMHRDSNLEFESEIPFDTTQVFLIEVVDISKNTISFNFETLYTLKKGKSYTLQLGGKTDSEGIFRYYAWWSEVVKT